MADTYQQALGRMGDVFVAHSGQRAIELIDQMEQPSLVILELQLPGLNGIAFLQELRSYADTSQTPVIIQSYMQTPPIEEMDVIREAFGVRQWLYKPRTSLKELYSAAKAYQGL